MKKIVLLNNEYDVVKDENNVFSLDEVESLITDHFSQYDYVLGDYSYGKLRLKGFYNASSKNKSSVNDYSKVDDYINNFCSYKCKYFIIKKIKKV